MDKKFKILIVLFPFLIAACTTLSNELSLEKIKPGERIYAARIQVKLNGEASSRCEIYLNGDLTPSIKLTPDGYVFYKTDRKSFKFKAIACYYAATERMAAWHLSNLPVKSVLRAENGKEVYYLGDLDIAWTLDRDKTIEAAMRDTESKGAVKIGRIDNSGELSVKVADNLEATEKEFWKLHPNEDKTRFQFLKKLISVGVDEE